MSASWVGALLGFALACGALMVVTRWRATAPLSLRERIAPFVPSLREQAPERLPSGLRTIGALLPSWRRSSPEARRSTPAPAVEQLVSIASGVGVGALLGFALALRGYPPVLALLLAAVGGVTAELARSMMRAQARRRLVATIAGELPDLAELLAFAIAAGESPPAAIGRVGAMAHGQLGSLLARASSEVRLGTPFDVAMRDLVLASGSSEVERFVDALMLAIERGTPLADVLRAQAADARAAQSRRLMESAGRKDVAMLIPVVFLILPTVVLIALYPGFRSLHLFIN